MSARHRILFVEDEDDIRTVVELALLPHADLELITFAAAGEALDYARDCPARIDMLLLNVRLPDMSGIDLMGLLLNEPCAADACWVFVTAHIFPQERAAYLRAGAAAVIDKPFDITTLPDTLRDVCADHLADQGIQIHQ